MKKKNQNNEINRIQRFSIRKYSFGAASVAIATYLMFMGNGAVYAAQEGVEGTEPKAGEVVIPKEEPKQEAPKAEEKAQKELVASKEKLASYVKEIEGNLSLGKYESKTEESLALLRDAIAEANQAANATTKAEVEKAYANLITTVNAKLKSKPTEKKETPAVDTTEGKETVGKKAENTEPKAGTNSIENTGSHDSRNEKEMVTGVGFRTEGNQAPTVELPYSNEDKRQIYIYTGENTDLTFTGKDETIVKDLYLRNKGLDESDNASVYGFTIGKVTNSAVASGEGTVSADKRTATIKMTGVTNLKAPNKWTSFIEAKDNDGVKSMPANESYSVENYELRRRKPGYVEFIVKSQTDKYDIKTPTEKVAVTDPTNVTEDELAKIKEKLKIEYSNNNDDANLADKKGTEVENQSDRIASITNSGNNIVVTYKDGSIDTISKGKLISGPAPVVTGNPKARNTILSTDEELSGTGTAGATVKVTIKNPEGTEVISEKKTQVEADGTWKLSLDKGLNSNEALLGASTAARTFYAPKNIVEVIQTTNGIDSEKTDVVVSIGPSKILPSAAANDGKSVVAGAKEVTFTVPHDAGFTYFFYTNKETNREIQLDIKREDDGSLVMAGGNTGKATVKETVKGNFYDTVTLTLTEPVKEGVNLKVIPHNGGATKGTYLGKTSYPVTNEAPVVAPVIENQNEKTVPMETTITKADLLALVKVTDHEDDLNATLGNKAHVRVVSVDGNTNVTGIDTSEAGEHTVIYKAVDSQGKESADYTYKVIVRKNNAPEVKIPYSVDGKKDVYVYTNEDIDLDIKYTDDSGKVASATVNRGGNQPLDPTTANPDVLDNEFDMTLTPVTSETEATTEKPAIVKIGGKVTKDTAGLDKTKFPKGDTDEYRLVTRYATATDTDGKIIVNNATSSSYATDPGSFSIVLKSQTKKYDIKELDEANKIVVSDTTNIPADELAKIKENIPLEYSKKNEDKNLADKKGTAVEKADAAKVVDTLVQKGDNLEVTYKDGSKDTIPVDKVVKLNKQPAIDAVNNKATDQITAINNNTALTPAEREKAIAKVNEDKTAALGKIDEATNNGAIETAKNDGNTAVSKVNPVAKEAAKQAVTDALKAKNDALDAREDLTQKEKENSKAAAKVEADKAIAKINEQPDTAPTPGEATTAQTAVDTGKTDGTTAIGKINPIGKQAALDKIDEALKAKEKEIDARTDLTDEEKKEVKDRAKEIADTKKEEINAKKNNADTPDEAGTIQGEINTVGTDGAAAITALAKDPAKKPEANTAVTNAAEAKKQSIQDDTALSPEAKKKLQDEVDEIKKASEEAINGAKKNADVDKAKKAGEQAIKAINSARLPGNKLVAKNPTNLDADEQAKLQKAIEAVNPGATVTVNPNGSASVILPNGKTVPLEQADLTKSADDLNSPTGGNNINRPVDKVIVKDPANLTDAEKAKIKQAVRDVNPNAVVTMDDNGTVTVSTPEGNTAAFPASELVRTLADVAKDDSGNAGVRKPADKLVGDATNADLQAKAIEKLKKLNGGDEKVKAINYDTEGNATVVLKDGTIATIPASDLFKTPEEAKKANGGDDINKPNSQTVVADKNALTEPEREAIKAKIAAVNPEGSVITVNEKGEATVTTPEGKTAVIDADDLVKGADEKTNPKAGNNINNPADRVQVAKKDELTDPELARIKAAVEAVNPGATVVVDDKGNATVTTPEGKTATIPVSELVKTPTDKDNVTGGNQVNTPADRVVVEDPAALTEDDKNAIKAKIQAVNPGAEVVFDANGNATVTIPAAPGEQPKTATIPASDLVKPKADLADPAKQDAVNKPADKVVVDPSLVAADATLPQEAKEAIKAAVAAVNPDSTVVVDDKGNATVTTPEGKTVVIPKADLVKKEADKETAKAGNNINKPVDKVVANKDALTPEDIKAIKAKVEAVNPGATVVVDDKGNATVVTPEGQTSTIPVTDLVKSPEEAKDAKAGNNVNKPADKVAATPEDLTGDKKDEVKAKIKAAVEAVNPEGSKVFVDDKGNATVTTPDGKTATIPVEDLIKDTTQPNAGNKVNTPATKVVVTDPANITADEDKIRAEILKVNPGATVAFDEKGNATVTTKDGAVATIPASDLAKDAADLTNPDKQDAVKKPADKTLVKKAGKLTDDEKAAIKAAVEKVNPSADPTKPTTVVVDNEGNATVTTPDGKTVVIAKEDLVKTAQEVDGPNAGNNINKPADKVSATPEDLTGDKKDEVKAKIQKAVEAVNPGATVFVDDKGNATVTKDGKTATIPVEDLLKAPAAKETATAGNKVNTPAERTVVVNPAELTDTEKAKITAAIQEVNPEGTKVVFDEAGNATVTVPNENGTTATATIPVSDLVKSNDKTDLLDPAKQNPVKKPIDQTVVADKDALTPTDKEKIAAKVKEVNPGSTVFVDDKGNATVTTTDGKTLVIAADDLVKTDDEVLSDPKAGNVINKPADGVFVKDGQITDDVKAKITAKVQRVNPGSTVFVDEHGNATVTTPEGKTATIPVADLTKTDAEKAKVNAGNKINSPADRVLVKDRDKLTAEDIQEIEKNILEVNPGATVVFDAKGNATVKNANGDIATIPVEALAKPKADLLKPEKQDLIKKPVDKVLVTDPANLDKEAIKKAVEEVNPGSTVVVDDNGNTTITTEDGRSFVIPAKDLVKTAEEAKNAKAGNNINKPADKVVVADPTKPLSQEEKKAIEAKIKEVNPDAKAIFVDDKGNATVTIEDKDGNTATATIPAKDLVTTPEEAKQPNAGNKVNTPADKVVVTDPYHLSDEDKAKITEAIKAVNPEANVVFDDKGNATVTTKDGEVATIPAANLVKTKEEAAKPNAGNNINTPADKVAVDSSKPLTEDDKKAIADKVAEVNPGATVAVDDKGNATVTANGKTAVIPAAALTKTADSAKEPNAGNDVVKPADKTVVANPESLTQDEQDAIAAKVAEVNPEAKTVVVDDKGNATVTTKDGKAVVIPAKDLVKTKEDAAKPNAGNDVNTPADKTVVANPDSLTQEEKDAIAAKVKAVNPGAEVVVDNKGNATVTKDGKVAVIPAADLTKTADSAKEPNAGNDVVKPADKTVVANPESLTQEEKEAIVAKVKAVNPDATVVVDDKGNATVTPKDGKPVVIPAADLTKSAADAAKQNAGNDIVKPADKTVVANPESLTQEEKDAIAAKVKAVNSGAEVVVDEKGNATVTLPNGKTAVIPAADLTKNADAEKAPNAGNDIVKPASKVLVKDPESLTKDEKDAIASKVVAVNPGSTVVVDEKGNATVTTLEGKTAVIPASDLTKSQADLTGGTAKDNAVTPAAKTKVADPKKLTDAEKKAIEDKVKAANPGAEVVVDDKGNATVVKDGNVSVIPSTDLVKVEDDATKPNGGNDANTPAAKTVVKDSANLTDEEKAAVKKAVAAVNPGSTVVVDDKGNATVTKADGTVLNIPASDLVIPADNLAAEAKNAKVKTPAFRTLVGDKEKLTDKEKAAVKKAIEAVNPGATVVVDDKGNATVTLPDGSTATISKDQLVKNAEEAKAKNGGDNLDFDWSKVPVGNINNITSEEKAKFQFMMLGAITDLEEFDISTLEKSTDDEGNTIYASKDGKVKITIDKDGNATIEKDGKKEAAVNIDKAGNVTIVTKEGKVLAIPRDDAFKQRPYVPQYDNTASKVDKAKLEVGIRNLDSLIASQADQLDAAKAKEAKALLAEAKEVFGNPKATQAEVDAMVKRLEEFKLNQASVATDDQAANNAANASNGENSQDAADAELAANVSKRNNQKELPNTGTSTFGTVLPAIAALLSGVGVFATKKKEDE